VADLSSPEAARLEAEADARAASGDLAGARQLLARAASLGSDRVELWLKLAGLCRGSGDLPAALSAVAGALRIEPLGFLPLLLKASLLEQQGETAEAGETYGYALAQLPASPPPGLAGAIAQARKANDAHIARKSDGLAAAQDAAGAALNAREESRLSRFRSNIVRRTRPYHAEPTHFHYPGLREREYHDREDFPWLATLEAATGAIAEDFQRVMAAERTELVPYVQYPDDVPLRQWVELNHNRAWTAIHLVQSGAVIEANARHCPATMAVLDALDQPHIPGRGPNAMFSLLAPGAHIPPHNGVSNARLVCHLPLIVPPGCWFRVGDDKRDWERGRAWVFDDTIEHEAMNGGDALRVILIIDTWHPDLSAAERKAVGAVVAASDSAGTEGL
jgi:aspartyl/asparaginyl beta-hydroxylase (cupin superfamily)